MAAYVKVVPQADWEILMRYLDDDGVVLVPENIAKERDIPDDGLYAETYDFGGEADIFVDLARTTDHFIFGYLNQENDQDDE